MTKAYAYLRVSGKGQVEGDGFPRQLAAIKAYAEKHDIKIVKTFRDEGVSGTKELEDRPALSELIQALHSNGVKIVLIENLSRLARDLMIQESILKDFERDGLQIISVTEPDMCSSDPTRKLIRQVLGAFSEYEKTMIVMKLRGARIRARAKQGHCEGRKAYGHREGENEVIQVMLTMRNEGLGFDRIAAALNAQGYKPRVGAKWHGFAVNKILTRQATA